VSSTPNSIKTEAEVIEFDHFKRNRKNSSYKHKAFKSGDSFEKKFFSLNNFKLFVEKMSRSIKEMNNIGR
jgi:hypothetical protein